TFASLASVTRKVTVLWIVCMSTPGTTSGGPLDPGSEATSGTNFRRIWVVTKFRRSAKLTGNQLKIRFMHQGSKSEILVLVSFLESPSGRSAPFESVGSFSPLRPIPLLCKLLFTIPTTTDAAIYTKP
ncbi:unnamed protein product, partial [Nesidiocoris tenuis]